ncbi:MAG: hypothetical protein IJ892_05710 [Prevotella sp.]|nr:hypothetical protein [Prevotella sp.]
MKTEDIDKMIGMPDVDAEWEKFEREVIGQEAAPHKRMAPWAWGVGIAAAIALLVMLNVGKGETEERPLLAQQTPQPAQPLPSLAEAELAQGGVGVATSSLPQNELQTPPTPPHLDGRGAAAQGTSADGSAISVGKAAASASLPAASSGRLAMKASPAAESPESKVFAVVEQMPYFPGGDRALMEFIKTNMHYPDLAMEYGARGRVITTFRVDSLGYTSNYKVVKMMKLKYDTLRLSQESVERQQQLREQIEQQLGEESLRILSLMPRWAPGKILDRCVNVKYTVPVTFQATEEERQTFFAQKRNEKLQGHIAGLAIVPASADLGPNAMRVTGTHYSKKDSILVVVNGQPIAKEEKIDDLHQYFFDRHQLVESIRVLKDDAARAIYGEQGKNCQGIVEITTTPFTPVSQLTPDQQKERRLAYLQDSYRKGFTEETKRDYFAPDLYDTPTKERLFGLLAQQYGRLRREYFGPVGGDAHGVYVPLIREAVIVISDPAWMDENGRIVTTENSPQLNHVISEIDQAASQADKLIERTDSFVRKAFIYGGTVAEGEPRLLYSDIWRYAPRGLWESTFHFLPDSDAPSFWCGEVYGSTSGQRRVVMHLHSVDKLYVADCPEILNNRRRVAGTVLNEQDEPLADVIVSMVGSAPAPETVQVRTDSMGHFELWLPFPDATIEVGHVGYLTTRLLHPADTTLTIRLKSATKLKELKVPAKKPANKIDIAYYIR